MEPICDHAGIVVYPISAEYLAQIHILLTAYGDNLFSDHLRDRLRSYDLFQGWWLRKVGDAIAGVDSYHKVVVTAYLTHLQPRKSAAIHVSFAPIYRKPSVTIPISFPVIRYFFERHGLEKIEAFTSESNRVARLYINRLGFVPDGRIRKHRRKNGRWITSLRYSILKEEFDENHPIHQD